MKALTLVKIFKYVLFPSLVVYALYAQIQWKAWAAEHCPQSGWHIVERVGDDCVIKYTLIEED